jgi:hypothetical protein
MVYFLPYHPGSPHPPTLPPLQGGRVRERVAFENKAFIIIKYRIHPIYPLSLKG